MKDGRYRNDELVQLVESDDRFDEVRNRVIRCEVVMIDEVSMLSKKIYEQLELVCRTARNVNFTFGGIQLVATGDFFQLPPVSNPYQQDNGEFCFTSHIWKVMMTHHVQFDNIHRQSDNMLIQAIKEAAVGNISEESNMYLHTLTRPLNEQHTVHLFATKYLAEIYNAEELDKHPGESICYTATDSGVLRAVKTIRAPKILAIKIGCPVMLIMNFNDMLVNGLQGTVEKAEPEQIDVFFPQLNISHTFSKHTFEVYSTTEGKTIATRLQFPLVLSYGMTIHKSQGLTLESVVVHCKGAFEAGQIAVALSRVKNSNKLQVLNFDRNNCSAPSSAIFDYYSEPTLRFQNKLDCCRHYLIYGLSNTECVTENINMSGDHDDSDFDLGELEAIEALKPLDVQEKVPDNVSEIVAPVIFDPMILQQKILENSKDSPMEKTIEMVTVDLSNKQTLFEKWVQAQYTHLASFMEQKINLAGSSTSKQWSDYYSLFYKYSISQEFSESLNKLYGRTPTDCETHVASSFLFEIQNQLLKKEKEQISGIEQPCTSSRAQEMSPGGRGKVRYVGAMCVAKTRYHLMNLVTNNLHKSKEKEKCLKAKVQIEMLDQIIIQYRTLRETTDDFESLQETERKQNTRHSLIHITDECTNFFMTVTYCIQTCLHKENLVNHKENLYQFVIDMIFRSQNAIKSWNSLFPKYPQLLKDELLHSIMDRYVKVNVKQFRKDMKDNLNMKRKEAHRKAIMNKSEKMKVNATKVSYEDILEDESVNKCNSHLKLRVAILERKDFFNSSDFTKKQLQSLCRAYDLQYRLHETKETLNGKLIQKIGDTRVTHMQNPLSDLPPDQTESSVKKRKAKGKGKGSAKKQVILCARCRQGNEDEPWVQCDLCDLWWHRRCAEINDEDWMVIEQEDEIWACDPCTRHTYK